MTNCFGIPDTYHGFKIIQAPDDLFYACDEDGGPVSDGYDTWDDLKGAMDLEAQHWDKNDD